MPSRDERLRQIISKVERAKKHIGDLQAEHRRFIDSKPYTVSTKPDPQTRQLVYYVSRADLVPESLSLIAGDAIQNLMSALDHLAYQIVCCDTADNPLILSGSTSL